VLGTAVPDAGLLLAAAALAVLLGLLAFPRFTRIRLVIRAGVEAGPWVTAPGISTLDIPVSSMDLLCG
jgi:branched-chain amino acid transport system permease protein